MKKMFFGLVCIGLIGVNVFSTYVGNLDNSLNFFDDLLLSNLETLAQSESGSNPKCYNGGPGSNACSIDGGIDIMGQGISASCSVQCNTGYYACCGLRCTCIKE